MELGSPKQRNVGHVTTKESFILNSLQKKVNQFHNKDGGSVVTNTA